MGKLIRTTEAAEMLGVHRQTIENWAEQGVLKIKKNGRAHYVDEDLIAQIADFASDVEASRKALEAVKADYERQKAEIRQARHEMINEWNEENATRRYKNLCMEGSLRSGFLETVLGILVVYGSLTEREGAMLTSRLYGKPIEEISREYGLTRERIQQIVHKAIRKSHDLHSLKAKLDEIDAINEMLYWQSRAIEDLKKKLTKYEEIEALEQGKLDEARRQEILKNDEMCCLLTKKLVDCDLSIRALNCLKYYSDYRGSKPIETIGDLISHSKYDLLKQRNFGRKTMNELDELLVKLNLEWSTDVDRIFSERILAAGLRDNTVIK